eukprot:c9509_g1_i1.p1 GENE.c9509_g1_i1~~c9509_g1_i1.p1  ORF type:complete len:309 (+),score=54.62 c9509_g1_i1:35-961(+)
MANALWRTWEDVPTQPIRNTPYHIIGFSIAALRTNFYIPELNIMLDAGISASYCPSHIFITHGHSDHCANLPYHLYTEETKSSSENKAITVHVPQIYVPYQSEQHFRDFVQSAFNVSLHYIGDDASASASKFTVPCQINAVKPNDSIPVFLPRCKKTLQVEIIECFHQIPCVGYGFSEIRQKLLPEYAHLSGAELKKLRQSGVQITGDVPFPFLCFLGDTDSSIFEHSSQKIFSYPTVMIECTFIDGDDLVVAHRTKHIHVSELLPHIRAHPEIQFIVYHFSQRYKKPEIDSFFQQLGLPNVFAWSQS